MPVYGHLIIGEAQFAEEVRIEQVMGNNVYGSMVVGELQAEPAAAPAAEDDGDGAFAAACAAASERMTALLGDGYTVTEAEQGLLAHPDIWQDLVLAEIARSKTAGARKGLVKSLLGVEGTEPELRAQLAELI